MRSSRSRPLSLVQLVLDARPHRDLDEGVELLRQVLAGSHVVPGMDHGSYCNGIDLGQAGLDQEWEQLWRGKLSFSFVGVWRRVEY